MTLYLPAANSVLFCSKVVHFFVRSVPLSEQIFRSFAASFYTTFHPRLSLWLHSFAALRLGSPALLHFIKRNVATAQTPRGLARIFPLTQDLCAGITYAPTLRLDSDVSGTSFFSNSPSHTHLEPRPFKTPILWDFFSRPVGCILRGQALCQCWREGRRKTSTTCGSAG